MLAYEPGADNAVLRVNRSPAFEFGNGRDEGRELIVLQRDTGSLLD